MYEPEESSQMGGKAQRREEIEFLIMNTMSTHQLYHVLRLQRRLISKFEATKESALIKLHLK
jgi:hypothetical protein